MKKFYLILIYLQGFFLFAQNPTDIDRTFGSFPGFDYPVSTVCTQPDGKIIVGGQFSLYQGQPQYRLIRLNEDGTKDNSFNIGSGFSHNVNIICLQADGKILVGGQFNTYNGQPQNGLIRLNPDGTKDTSFDIGSGFYQPYNYPLRSICLQPDGKILVGGSFYSFQGKTQKSLIRLNADGSKDDTFNIGTGFSADYEPAIKTICLQDGKIIVGGVFITYNSKSAKNLIRLNPDGTIDNNFITPEFTGTDNNISTMCLQLQQDGKIMLGWSTYSYPQAPQCYLARLNHDGTKDDSFNINATNSLGLGEMTGLCLQPDGKIIVGGSYHLLARFNSDGTKDTSFESDEGPKYGVDAICLQQNGKILVGGTFISYKNESPNKLIRLNQDTSIDHSLKLYTGSYPGLDNTVNKICVQQDGKILVGGKFETYQAKRQKGLIRFNPDGNKDDSFDIGTGFNREVSFIHQQPDGKIVAAGYFTSYNEQSQNGLVRLNADGTKDTSFDIGSGFNMDDPSFQGGAIDFYITAMDVQPDGKILVGGFFNSYQGNPQKGFIRLNPDGSIDSSFTIATGYIITNDKYSFLSNICVQPDGKILVTVYEGYQRQTTIIRLNPDGTLDDSFNAGAGFGGAADAFYLQKDGKILIGFFPHQGQVVESLVRLNSDGSLDNTFQIGLNGRVTCVYQQADGKILVAGSANSQLSRLNADGTVDDSFDIGTGLTYGAITTICTQKDGKILLGGFFPGYHNTESSCLVRLNGDYAKLSRNEFAADNKFTFYPNPVKDKITISSASHTEFESAEVYDMNGKMIARYKNLDDSLNVSNLNSGLYLLKICTDGKYEFHKFIKE